MKRKVRIAAFALFVLAPAASHAVAELKVVATTPDYAALAQAIGGDEISIKALAKPAEDPHFVDARPSHVVTLNRADMLIESGADLEVGWLPPLIQGSRNRKVLPGEPGRFLGSEGVRLLDVPTVLDRSRGDVHAKGNPHFLMNPENSAIVAHRLTERFCELDAGSCPAYQANLGSFNERLEQRMLVWTARLAPHKGAQLVTYHDTWKYFAERFKLRSETYLEPKPGIPPSPPHLGRVIAKMKAEKMRVILVEPFQSRKTAKTVAGHTDAIVVDVGQFPGGLAETDDDYLALIDAVVEAVAAALDQTAAD